MRSTDRSKVNNWLIDFKDLVINVILGHFNVDLPATFQMQNKAKGKDSLLLDNLRRN